jgi:phage host-nuclease inhibitor protein Gam
MATPAKTRLKAKAQLYVPQNRDEAAAEIRKIGDLQREFFRAQAAMNDDIAVITASAQPVLEQIKTQITSLQEAVQGYCEANRDDLTNGGKVKTANLVTGEVSWRVNPPSVKISKASAVLEMLERLKLVRFIRNKPEINKEAILLEPETVRDLAGISIVSGVEEFIITPFEQEAA